MKIRPVEAQLFHADGRTDSHDEANSRSSQFCEHALKLCFRACVAINIKTIQSRYFSKIVRIHFPMT